MSFVTSISAPGRLWHRDIFGSVNVKVPDTEHSSANSTHSGFENKCTIRLMQLAAHVEQLGGCSMRFLCNN
jgi:hypothetical protein